MNSDMHPEVLKFLAQQGSRGGSKKSPKKTEACRANAKKPRKRKAFWGVAGNVE